MVDHENRYGPFLQFQLETELLLDGFGRGDIAAFQARGVQNGSGRAIGIGVFAPCKTLPRPDVEMQLELAGSGRLRPSPGRW